MGDGGGEEQSGGAVSRIEDRVVDRIRERAMRGAQKYGTTMERLDLSRLDWLRHAQEEAMDLAVYLERLIRDEEAKA